MASPARGHRSLSDWLDYLKTIHAMPIEMSLERIREVQEKLDLCEFNFPVITVGGTNGKGSTCAFLEAILRAAGYKTGMFTSPHLLRYNERIKIDGQEARDLDLCAAFAEIEAVRQSISLTYFEFAALAALLIFRQQQCQVAVLEVGLGGRLDATNVFNSDCAVITSIGIDHVHYLGTTREDIGYEKAGIFRPHTPAICAEPDPPQRLVSYASSIHAKLLRINEDFGFKTNNVSWDFWHHRLPRYALPYPTLKGQFQLYNASAALAALSELSSQLPVTIADIRKALVEVTWPGRFQVVPGRPAVIFDVAHNPHAATALAATLQLAPPAQKNYAVCGILQDKDMVGILTALLPQIDVWLFTNIDSPRAAPATELKALLKTLDAELSAQTFDNPVTAFESARQFATENDRIIVFGSFHTVAPVLAFIQGA